MDCTFSSIMAVDIGMSEMEVDVIIIEEWDEGHQCFIIEVLEGRTEALWYE